MMDNMLQYVFQWMKDNSIKVQPTMPALLKRWSSFSFLFFSFLSSAITLYFSDCVKHLVHVGARIQNTQYIFLRKSVCLFVICSFQTWLLFLTQGHFKTFFLRFSKKVDELRNGVNHEDKKNEI